MGLQFLSSGSGSLLDSTGHIPASYSRQVTQQQINLRRTNALAETINRIGGVANIGSSTLTTGRPVLVACRLLKDTVVSNIVFTTGSTAGATITHTWFGLWDSTYTLLKATADDTATTAWSATTERSLALSSSYTVTADATFYLSICVSATTMPNTSGVSITGALGLLAPMTVGLSPTLQTAPPTVGTQISGTFTGYAGVPWAYVT